MNHSMLHIWVRRLFLAIGAALLGAWANAEESKPATFEVHDFGFWIADPGLAEMNAVVEYPNDLPVSIESPYRSREPGPRGRKISSHGFLMFHGTGYKPIDVTLEIDKGRFASHWPGTDVKSSRIRWLDLQVAAAADEGLVRVPEHHWFESLRKVTDLYVQKGARSEAALLYDPELTIGGKFPLKLTGKGGDLTLSYAGDYPLLDVLVLTHSVQGRQYAWIDKIEPYSGAGAKKDEGQKGEKVEPKAAGEAVNNAINAIADAATKLAQATNAGQGARAAKPASQQPALPATPANQSPEAATQIKIELGPLLNGDELKLPLFKELAERLQNAGLTEKESQFLVERYGNSILETTETLVLYRVPSSVLDKRLRLTLDPEPKQLVRTALVLNLGIDPQQQTDMQELISQLGSKQFRDREKAESKLQASGQAAIEFLKKESKNNDPEIAFRVKRILQALHQDVKDD